MPSTQQSSQASSQSLINQTAELLFPRVWTVQDRKELLIDAFATTHGWILGYIEVDGPPNAFVSQCLNTLIEQDCALVSHFLLTFSRSEGMQTQINVQNLIVAYQTLCIERAAREKAIRPRAMYLDDTPNRPVVFLSYADADATYAEQLQATLARYGHTCWGQRLPQKGSDAWLTSTAAGLSQAYAVVLVVGEQTRQDRWVQVELLSALDKQKRIIPVRIGAGALPPCLPTDLSVIALDSGGDISLEALLSRLPAPPAAPSQEFWTALSPALIHRANELLYMDRLKLAELHHVAQYTHLSGGAAIQRTPSARLTLQPVVACTEYTHMPWRQQAEAPVEHRRFEDAVVELKTIRRAVLLGDPGSGKTTTLYKLASDLIDTALLDDSQPIPVMVRLGSWTDATEPFVAFLRRSVAELAENWDERLLEKRIILLLDGINEIPAGQQTAKYRQVAQFLAEHPDLFALVSCRELDYPLERDLGLDRVVVAPLDAVRVHQFVHNYLDAEYGVQAGEGLFWQLAGADATVTYQRFNEKLGDKLPNPFATFWLAPTLPADLTWGWDWSDSNKNHHWEQWLQQRAHPASLLMLATNPYMLFMLVDVYQAYNQILPANRGQLFDWFTTTLLRREQVQGANREALLDGLTNLAFGMQERRQGNGQEDSALTVLPLAAVAPHLDTQQQYLAVSANLLTINDTVRFAHQLLQEYFVARAMRERIWGQGEAAQQEKPVSLSPGVQNLKAEEIWQPHHWWQPTNWEEATILLAGLYSNDCTPVLDWLADAQPELEARCIVESGAYTSDETKLRLRDLWLPRLTGLKHDPEARARAAVGRALGRVALADGTPLDNRPGVGFVVRDGIKIPDIAWGAEVPVGTYTIGGDKVAYDSFDKQQVQIMQPYQLARYPVTCSQFDCFVTASDFSDRRWWKGLPEEERQIDKSYFSSYTNSPRERVSWYQAVAFCRWLSDKLDYGVDLPHEHEWEVAARVPDKRLFPWGNEFDSTKANTSEGENINQTTAVGIYPQGQNKALGLDDLIGNVWEWCRNKYDDPDESQVDQGGDRRVVRGGSWVNNQSNARAASRDNAPPTERNNSNGFRVVRRPPSHDH